MKIFTLANNSCKDQFMQFDKQQREGKPDPGVDHDRQYRITLKNEGQINYQSLAVRSALPSILNLHTLTDLLASCSRSFNSSPKLCSKRRWNPRLG